MDQFQIYEKGPKIYKFGPWTPITPHPCHGIEQQYFMQTQY